MSPSNYLVVLKLYTVYLYLYTYILNSEQISSKGIFSIFYIFGVMVN